MIEVKNNTKKIVLMGMFISLSFVCSFIKFPGPVSSIALDSMPAYLGGLLIGGPEGALIGFIAHILTALNSGFPQTLPVHMIIAVIMALTILIFSFARNKANIIIATIVGTIINGAGAPFVLMLLPNFDFKLFIAITPVLLLASLVNILMADFIGVAVEKAGFNFKDKVKSHEA